MLPYLLHGYPLTDRDALQLLLTCSTDTSSLLPLITCNMDIHFQLISKIITTSIFFITIMVTTLYTIAVHLLSSASLLIELLLLIYHQSQTGKYYILVLVLRKNWKYEVPSLHYILVLSHPRFERTRKLLCLVCILSLSTLRKRRAEKYKRRAVRFATFSFALRLTQRK